MRATLFRALPFVLSIGGALSYFAPRGGARLATARFAVGESFSWQSELKPAAPRGGPTDRQASGFQPDLTATSADAQRLAYENDALRREIAGLNEARCRAEEELQKSLDKVREASTDLVRLRLEHHNEILEVRSAYEIELREAKERLDAGKDRLASLDAQYAALPSTKAAGAAPAWADKKEKEGTQDAGNASIQELYSSPLGAPLGAPPPAPITAAAAPAAPPAAAAPAAPAVPAVPADPAVPAVPADPVAPAEPAGPEPEPRAAQEPPRKPAKRLPYPTFTPAAVAVAEAPEKLEAAVAAPEEPAVWSAGEPQGRAQQGGVMTVGAAESGPSPAAGMERAQGAKALLSQSRSLFTGDAEAARRPSAAASLPKRPRKAAKLKKTALAVVITACLARWLAK